MELAAKQKLRDATRRDRELLRNSERKLFQWLHLINADEIQRAATIATYYSYGDEPSTHVLNDHLLKAGKNLLLPRMQPDKSLQWVRWDGQPSTLKGNRQVMEPVGTPLSASELATIDVVIVPALLVDRAGFRLGQGGGSYDRALAEISGWKVALVYNGEIVSTPLPHESHDQRVNAVATPELLLRFKS